MFRLGAVSFFTLIVVGLVAVGSPPDDVQFMKALAVQNAMTRASGFLAEMNSKQAVEILEQELPSVNNNPQYLSLLRDSYRAYIRDLHLANQPELARRYLDRLCILDPRANSDVTLKPHADTPTRTFEQDPPRQAKPKWPNWSMQNLFAKKEEAKFSTPIKPSVFRGASAESSQDPFEKKNQRFQPIDQAQVTRAKELVNRGMTEFKKQHYAEARICFEQAYTADRECLDGCKDSWAYCILAGVAQAIEQPGAIPAQLPELRKQVDEAIQMAPTKMMAVGQELLQTLDQRGKQFAVAAPVSFTAVKVRHLGANKEGWQVADTAHFRIFHQQSTDFAERLAQVAESTRSTMYRKWFDSDGGDWTPICELIVHPTGAAYTQMTGVPKDSPGHSRIECDPNGRVVSRRLDVRNDIPSMAETVLPHEATHVVLAGMFDGRHVPRWADEGIAVLSEPDSTIATHRRNLLKQNQEGNLFGLKELMELKDYPQPRRIGAFYAQSVVLVEFLTKKRGPKTVTEFVRDGLRNGYESALQRHYNMTFAQLEQAWHQEVLANERFVSK